VVDAPPLDVGHLGALSTPGIQPPSSKDVSPSTRAPPSPKATPGPNLTATPRPVRTTKAGRVIVEPKPLTDFVC